MKARLPLLLEYVPGRFPIFPQSPPMPARLGLVSRVRVDQVDSIGDVPQPVHSSRHVHAFIHHQRIVKVPKGVPVDSLYPQFLV